MELDKLHLTKRINANLEKKGITDVESLLRFFPLRYYDFTHLTGILPKDKVSCVAGYIKSMKKSDSKSFAFFAQVELDDGSMCTVTWFHMPYLYERVYAMKGSRVLICGKFNYSFFHKTPETANPVRFTSDIESGMEVVPVYPSIKGIKACHVPGLMMNAMRSYAFVDYHSPEFKARYGLMGLYESFRAMHSPDSMGQQAEAEQRFLFDDMLYFALTEKQLSDNHVSVSPFITKKQDCARQSAKNSRFSFRETRGMCWRGFYLKWGMASA